MHFEQLSPRLLPALSSSATPIRLEPEENPFLIVLAVAGGYLLRFVDMADFEVSGDGGRIRCCPMPGLPHMTIAHLLLDHVIPRALTLRDRLVLHASGVAVGGRAIIFVGPTGQGKSTLAVSFGRAGVAILGDDTIVVESRDGGMVAVPSYPGVRLWAETVECLAGEPIPTAPVAHYTSKLRLGRDAGFGFAEDPLPLARLYILDSIDPAEIDAPVAIDRLGLSQAFFQLLPQAFRLDASDPSHLRADFERLASQPVLRLVRTLRFPRRYDRLAEIRGAVLRDVESSA